MELIACTAIFEYGIVMTHVVRSLHGGPVHRVDWVKEAMSGAPVLLGKGMA